MPSQGRKAATTGTSGATSTAQRTPSPMPTIVELVSNIITAIDDIYKPDEATGLAKRNVPVSKLAEIRTQAQRALDAVTKQPTNADLLSAIKSMQGKVETRTEEVLKGISKTNSTWADVAANARLAP